MLKFLKKELILSLALLLALTACARKPESPLSPSVKIGVEKKGEDKIFAVNFTCGLKNENDSTAFTNINGVIEVKNNSSEILLTVPFKIPAILPFETGIVQERIELTADEASPLLDLLAIKKEQIESGEDQGNRFIEDRNIVIKKLDLEKKDIIELLRSKLK
ncbi:MAG TPA: hypothetical protein PKG60_16000 [Spirochaetota bacterium]|nr:hypothetical protein [Spirochaetota bacterium]HPS86175.1 hypothetical protein [Spirochaetota bacterium]